VTIGGELGTQGRARVIARLDVSGREPELLRAIEIPSAVIVSLNPTLRPAAELLEGVVERLTGAGLTERRLVTSTRTDSRWGPALDDSASGGDALGDLDNAEIEGLKRRLEAGESLVVVFARREWSEQMRERT
jgi:hypothetical protein